MSGPGHQASNTFNWYVGWNGEEQPEEYIMNIHSDKY